jgi:hypothetical protein
MKGWREVEDIFKKYLLGSKKRILLRLSSLSKQDNFSRKALDNKI